MQRRWRAVELGHWPHESLRSCGGTLSGDRLGEYGRANRRSAVHVPLLRRAVLGEAGPVAKAVAADVRRKRHDADVDHDWRARPSHADAPVGRVLRSAQDAWSASDAAALR